MRPALRNGVNLVIEDGRVAYGAITEADLRDCIAGIADAAGFEVHTEAHLPGWGRIDVLIHEEPYSYVVEVKKALETPREIRQGLQQVHAYAEAWRRHSGWLVRPFLVGEAVADNADGFATDTAYAEVKIQTVGEFMWWLAHRSPSDTRRLDAVDLLNAARHEVAIRRAVIAGMPSDAPVQHPAEVFAELVAEFGGAA